MQGLQPHPAGTVRPRSVMCAALFILLWNPILASPASAQSNAFLHILEKEIVTLVDRVEPTVASVIVQRRFINTVNGQTLTDWERSIGTGVVLHRDGFIITTAGLVDHAHDILVSFKDGQYRLGELVGVDPLSDIAVIRVDSVSVQPARLGDSDTVSAGSWVLVLNNDQGFPPTMTTGIVNGVREEDVMMQVSTVVGGAFSGGAVFSTKGRLLGLVADSDSGKAVLSRGVRGIERTGVVSVTPINRVKHSARQLIEFGEIRRSWLGVHVEKIWDSVNLGGDRNIMLGTSDGMEVTYVYPDSPAMDAGLRKDDILQAVNGIPMNHPIILAEFVTSIPTGTRIEIRYLRENTEQTAHTVLASQPKLLDSPASARILEGGSEDPLAREDPRLIRQMIMEHELELEAHRLKLNQLKQMLDERTRQITPRAVTTPPDDGF